MPSVKCLPLSDVSFICRVTYFQFQIQSAFLPRRPASRTAAYLFITQYQTSDVAKNLGKDLSRTRRAAQENTLELILTVKMEIRHPREGYFNSKFPAICNHYKVMAA